MCSKPLAQPSWWLLLGALLVLTGSCARPPAAPQRPTSPTLRIEAHARRGTDRAELHVGHHKKPADSPGEAAAFRYLQRRGAGGFVPGNALPAAKLQRDNLLAAQRRALAAPPSAEPIAQVGGISPGSWTWLGPGNIGGRIRAMLIHPTQPNTMWIGSVSGGIWKTLDGGNTWWPLNDFLASLAVSCMAMHPSDPDLLYAGTGEGFFNADALPGAGVFASFDGGATWGQLASTAPPPDTDPGLSPWGFVNRMAIDPTDGSILLAATNQGLYQSLDSGVTWTQRIAGRTLDVRYHPTSGRLAIAGTSAAPASSAFYSTDGGVTWLAAAGLPGTGRIELAYAASNPNTVYASVDRNQGELYLSTDGGRTYALNNTGTNYLAGQGWYDNAIWVDPTNERMLIVGGIDLWRSTNGGADLTRISDWRLAPSSPHADHHIIVHHPGFNGSTNRSVYVGNDGGIYWTPDVHTASGTIGWAPLNQGLGITQFYGGAVNATGSIILGGTQDNGTLVYRGGTETWTEMSGGDGGFCAADSVDPNRLYGEYIRLRIYRSTDGGATASYIHNTGGVVSASGDLNCPGCFMGPGALVDALLGQANFIAPFVIDPNNPAVLWAGGRSLWRSANASGPAPIWTQDPFGFPSNISAIAVARGDSNRVYVGTNAGGLFRSDNAMAMPPAWTTITGTTPGRFCTRLAVHPLDPNLVYATFSGYRSDNVWRSEVGGQVWSDASGTGEGRLPAVPVNTLALHPTEPDWIYIGTDLGVFASTDAGNSWSTTHDGPANVEVDELLWRDARTLVAVTHGRGMYQADAGAFLGEGLITRVSVSSAGQQSNAHSRGNIHLSHDGRFVLFGSNASNFVPGDGNAREDAFLHDRQNQTTTLASPMPDRGVSPFGTSRPCSSADLRLIAFSANQTVGSGPQSDAFVFDRQTGITQKVSLDAMGNDTDEPATLPALSGDGRFVAFYRSNQLELYDRQQRRLATIAESPTNIAPASLSMDGQWLVYQSVASPTSEIIRVNRLTGARQTVSMHSEGVPANGHSLQPTISADGRFIAFLSQATNLVEADTNARDDVFVHDTWFATTRRVSVSSTGAQSNNHAALPRLSADGRMVVFQSAATNLVANDTNGRVDIFAHHLETGATTRMSLNSAGVQANNSSFGAAVSGNGRFVAFANAANNLVNGDTNGLEDVFVRDRGCLTIALQPESVGVDAGVDVTFRVVADGASSFQYQWRRENVPLTDGGRIAGAGSARLTVRSVRPGDAGDYDVRVTNDCGSILSGAAGLVVENADQDADGVPDELDQCPNTIPHVPVDAQGCPPVLGPDLDRDGDVDAADLRAFQSCFAGPEIPPADACQAQDFDADGDIDQEDFARLQRCYSGPSAFDMRCTES